MLALHYFVRRFILHNDDNNPMLLSLEKFGFALKSFSPHLIIVSGLQMLDSFPFEPGEPLLYCCAIRRLWCLQWFGWWLGIREAFRLSKLWDHQSPKIMYF